MNLTKLQQKKLAKLEKDTKAKLYKILTPEQQQTLEEARPPRPGQGGPDDDRRGLGGGQRRGGPGGGQGGPGGGPDGPGGGQPPPPQRPAAGSEPGAKMTQTREEIEHWAALSDEDWVVLQVPRFVEIRPRCVLRGVSAPC